MDHLALFNAVKHRDTHALHGVLGPTLRDLAAYRVHYWDHAQDGILTSLNKLPRPQGYACLRWAERTLSDYHERLAPGATDAGHAASVYKLRADLLDSALRCIDAFEPGSQREPRQSTTAAIRALYDDARGQGLADEEWLHALQRRATSGDAP